MPARFTADSRSLQKRIRFPDSDGDVSLEIACDAWLNERGAFRMNYCYAASEADREFHAAISFASRRARIAPALVGGKPRPVWLQYRVRFVRQGASEQVMVFPNHGLQVDVFGAEYSGPQRIETGSANLSRCDNRTRLWIQATVSEQGEPTAVVIEPDGTGTEACRSAVVDRMRSARFVAATANGSRIGANYRELLFCAASIPDSRDCRLWF